MGLTPIMGSESDELALALLARVDELEDRCAQAQAEVTKLQGLLAREQERVAGLLAGAGQGSSSRQHAPSRANHGQGPPASERAPLSHGNGRVSAADVSGQKHS